MRNGAQEPKLLQHVIEKFNAHVVRIVKHSVGAGCATLSSLIHENQHANSRCS